MCACVFLQEVEGAATSQGVGRLHKSDFQREKKCRERQKHPTIAEGTSKKVMGLSLEFKLKISAHV